MDAQEKISTAFWSQLGMLTIPVTILLILKTGAFLIRRFVPEEKLNEWFKPKAHSDDLVQPEDKAKKPKLTQGPFIEKPSDEMPYLPDSINSLMQVVPRRHSDRGVSDSHDWLTAYHTFTFGKYKDPKFIGYGAIRVMNEEFIKPGQGYPQLVRQDFEVLTIVLSGTLRHIDSLENETILPTGHCQIMTFGKGVTHIEENASPHTDLHYIQLWLAPNFSDLEPQYRSRDFNASLVRNRLVTLTSPYFKVDQAPAQNVTTEDLKRQELPGASDLLQAASPKSDEKKASHDFPQDACKHPGTLGLHSDTYIYQCLLEPGCKVKVPIQPGSKRKAYVHLVGSPPDVTPHRGLLSINYEERLLPGDGAFLGSLTGVTGVDLKNIGQELCQFIFLDMA